MSHFGVATMSMLAASLCLVSKKSIILESLFSFDETGLCRQRIEIF